MPSVRFQRVFRASVILSTMLVLVVPAGAHAATFEQIEQWFPALATELSHDPVLPSKLNASEDDGVANADATTDGSGLFVVSPEGALRDDDGAIVDPDPRWAATTAGLRPLTGGGLADIRLPRSDDHWLELGDGIRIRLVGRRAAKHTLRPGAALYGNVLDGTDQLFTLDPDSGSVEEFLVVAPTAEQRLRAAYVVSLPTGWKLTTAKQNRKPILTVRDRRGKARLRISAPTAVDSTGREHPVSIELAATNRFVVSVHPKRGKPVRGVLVIDPLYAKTINPVYPTGDGGKPYYTGEVCGNLADHETDYPGWDGQPDTWRAGNPWLENGATNEVPNPFNPCDAENSGPLVEFSSNTGADDAFAASRGTGAGQGNGVTVAVRSGKTAGAGSLAWARINAPDNVGVWESDFRGHTGDYGALADPDVRCEMRVGPRRMSGMLSEVPTSMILPYYSAENAPVGRSFADNANVFFFGGYPYGSDGGGAWAQCPFPDHPSASIGAGYRWPGEVPHDADQNRHMWARFSMNADAAAAQDLWNMPRYVEMRLAVRKQVAGGDHRCSADGRWRVVFRDAVNPVAAPPTVPAGWHSNHEVATANGTVNHEWRQVSASDVEGSGVKLVESLITGPANSAGATSANGVQLGENVCDTGSSGTQETKVSAGAQPCSTADVWRINNRLEPVSNETLTAAFRDEAGPHRFQWRATDFANREDVSAAATLVSTPDSGVKPLDSQVGWYWVDANPPSCAMTTPYISNGIATFTVTGRETTFQDAAGMRIRRGSGIARIQVFKIPRLSGFDYNNPPLALRVLDQPYSLDALRSGEPIQSASLAIPLSVAEQEGDFKLVAIVTDGVGHTSFETGAVADSCNTASIPPVDCTGATLGTLRLYRGASGVLARWTNPSIVPPGSAGRVETKWQATITKPDGTVEVRAGVTQGGEVFIDAPPASQVDIRIDGQCTPFQGTAQATSTLTGTEFVDARPDVTIGALWRAVDTRPAASKFRRDGAFDPEYETLHVAVSDPNGFTTQRTGTNYNQPASIQRTIGSESDRARVLVRITPDRAASPVEDTPATAVGAEAYLVWEIGTAANGAPHRFWLVDGPVPADAYTRSFASLPSSSTCTAGSGRIDTPYWSLDCATSVPTVIAADGSGDRGTRSFQVDLDLVPRDNAAHPISGTPERFPTPDRDYAVAVAVRDQRQEADQRYLHHDQSKPANEQISPADTAGFGTDTAPGLDRVGTIVVDREQPNGDFAVECADQFCALDEDGVLHVRDQVRFATNHTRDVDPAVGDPSPSSLVWRGLGAVYFEAHAAAPIGTGFTPASNLSPASCADPLPYMPATPGTRCERTYTTDPNGDIPVPNDVHVDVATRAHVVDVVRNVRVLPEQFAIDHIIVDREDPVVEPVAIKGASGIAGAWPAPVDVSHPLVHQWRCDAPGPLADDPNPYTADPGWSTAYPAERAGWTSSGICPGAPGQDVTVWIRVIDAVGNITITSVHRQVDERPVLTNVSGHSDPGIWNDAWDDPKWDPTIDPRDRRNDTLRVHVTDPDDIVGNASRNDTRVADVIAGHQPVTAGDRGILVLRVDDPRSTTDGYLVIQPRAHDADGDEENAAATPTLDGAHAWLVASTASIDETTATPVASGGCELGQHTLLTTDWWEFDCARFDASLVADTTDDPYGSRLELNLPLRAFDNTTDHAQFVTPDDRYDVSGWVRDQRQPADNQYLTQLVAGTGAAPAPDATFATARTWRALGVLRTDRIDPTALITLPNQSTRLDHYDAIVNDGSYTHLDIDVLAGDLSPGAAAAGDLDVLAGDVATGANRNTATRYASGLDHVAVEDVRVSGGAVLDSDTNTCPGTGVQLLLDHDARHRCTIDVDLRFVSGSQVDVEVDLLVVDQAGNYQRYTRRFQVLVGSSEPGGTCGDGNGYAPLVDIAQGSAHQLITSDDVARPIAGIATSNPMTFETAFAGAGQSGFGNGCHANQGWLGTVEFRPIAGTPWSPARPGGLDIASLQTTHQADFRPDLGERFATWRAWVELDGTPMAAPTGLPTAITRRVTIATVTLANGDTRSAFVEVISRMEAVSNGSAQPAYAEVRAWVGPDATTRRPIVGAPDVTFTIETTAKCMHGCEDTPLIPF